MAYQVNITKRAAKELAAIPETFRGAVAAAILALATTPRPDGVKKLKAKKNQWRIRVGDYRVIYSVEDGKTMVVEVIRVGDRKEIYD